jgi:hypothetical protein
MGSSTTWIAVEKATGAEVAAALGLRQTGQPAGDGHRGVVGAALANGWYVVVTSEAEDRLASAASLGKLSVSWTVLTGFLEDHVMASHCALWRSGKRRWKVDHKGEESSLHLVTSGKLPEEFAAIRDAAISQQEGEGGAQAGVDHVYEVPMALSRALIGFRPDEDDLPAAEILEEPRWGRMWRNSGCLRTWGFLLLLFSFLAICMMAFIKFGQWVIPQIGRMLS